MCRSNNKNQILSWIVIFLLLCGIQLAEAADNQVDIYFFRGEGCSHCAEEEPYLQTLVEQYGDSIEIHDYELWYHPENVTLVEQFAAAYGFEPSGVPMTFIGNQYWIGFNEDRKVDFVNAIEDGLANGALDPMDVANGKVTLNGEAVVEKPSTKINVPLIGEVDLENQSLFITTLIIALVDGVNPCSLWVLTMLLAIIVHTDSRKKTLIIGLVYLTVTAGVYALFILGVFTVLSYMSYVKWIQLAVACITLVMGLINLKDYFFFKEGVSMTIDDAKKPGIYQKMRNVVKSSDNFWAMIGATIVLGLGVSLVEFSCTAAFPVVWSNILVSHHATRLTFGLLLLLYMVLYQLDEMVIFGVAVVTMKSKKMEEKHGQMLKLFSGCLMVILSLVMILKPAMMNDLTNTLLVFALAVLITAAILLMTSVILPKFGIYAGHNKPQKEHKGHHHDSGNK